MNQLSNEHVEALRAVGFKPSRHRSSCMTLKGGRYDVDVGYMHIDGAEQLSVSYTDHESDFSTLIRLEDGTTPEELVSCYHSAISLVSAMVSAQRKTRKRTRN